MRKKTQDALRNNTLFSDSGSPAEEPLDLDTLTPDQAMKLARQAKAEAVSPRGIKGSGISFGRTSKEGTILDAAGQKLMAEPRAVIDNPQRYKGLRFDPRSKPGDFEKLTNLKVQEVQEQESTKKPWTPSGPNESGGGETASDTAENAPGYDGPGDFLGPSTQNALGFLGKVYGIKTAVSALLGVPLTVNPAAILGILGVSAFNDFMDSRDEVPEKYGPTDLATYNKDYGPRNFKDRVTQAYHTLGTKWSAKTPLHQRLDQQAADKMGKQNTSVSSLAEVLGPPQYSPIDPDNPSPGPMGMTGFGGFQGLGIGNPSSYGGGSEDSGGPGPGDGPGSGAEGSSGGGTGGSDAGSEDSGGGGW
jgi:hypothetical protein